ncbi:sortase [Candidatus Saccharibacteria bacterium]|nr:sortase [Candidatus Saccharibacteria bacterium]
MINSDDSSNTQSAGRGSNPAADIIRDKINSIYGKEPSAKKEIKDVESLMHRPSKHQVYMRELSSSGRSLADIQTAWHNYYINLPDEEKHRVWKEFYANHKPQEVPKNNLHHPRETSSTKIIKTADPKTLHSFNSAKQSKNIAKHPKTVAHLKNQLLSTASTRASVKLKAKQHFQSLLFGVGMGSIVVLILLFGFFNDRFIAPFITPSRAVSNTPILIDSNGSVGIDPKIIIPKINVEIPVVYDEPSIEEHAIQNALERGVVHYATTPNPGENGNSVIFGHSSNNILNKGKYKFAFVLLNRLEINDTFYINKDGVRYAYRIYEKRIVNPTEVDVLNSTSKTATATLITCDPPGTTLNRLVVIGEQISPNPSTNKDSSAKQPDINTTIIPSNAPSLWQRIKNMFLEDSQ